MGRWFKNLLTVGVVIVLIVWIREFQQRGLAEGVAPALTGTDMRGDEVSLEHFRGEPVLLHFWASWCSVCRFEQGSIQSIAEDWPVLTVAMQSGESAEVKRYLEQHGLTFQTVSDPEGQLAGVYGVRGVPTSFVVDDEGKLRFTEVGYTTEIGLRIRLWLASVL